MTKWKKIIVSIEFSRNDLTECCCHFYRGCDYRVPFFQSPTTAVLAMTALQGHLLKSSEKGGIRIEFAKNRMGEIGKAVRTPTNQSSIICIPSFNKPRAANACSKTIPSTGQQKSMEIHFYNFQLKNELYHD